MKLANPTRDPARSPRRPILERRVLREDIKKYFIDLIVAGELKPGQRIVETKIAKDLQVSQAPVREALRELEAMGLVETRPYQGTFIRELTRERIREAYEVRQILEGEAARRAAKRITPEDLAKLDELVREMQEAARRGDRSDFVEKDIDFHATIFAAAGNELLYQIWVNVRMGNFTLITTQLSRRSLPDLAERHRCIVEGLKIGDADLASQQAELHIAELAEEVLKKIPAGGKPR